MLIDSGRFDRSQPESGIAPNPDVPAPQQHPALLVKDTTSGLHYWILYPNPVVCLARIRSSLGVS